jgi:hypothetical protein
VTLTEGSADAEESRVNELGRGERLLERLERSAAVRHNHGGNGVAPQGDRLYGQGADIYSDE